MSINEKSLSAGSFVLNPSIAIMAIAIAGREIRDWRSNQDSQPAPPVFDPEWRTAVGAATAISNPSAKVTLVEFLDFECPVCQQTHGVIGALARKYSARLSIAYVHFPLKNHKYARLGAFAVECSKRYGKLPEAMDAVFRDQVHLARFSAGAFARGVGIADSVGFVACLSDSTNLSGISEGRTAGEALAVKGTPTIFVNGWRFRGGVPERYLSEAIDDLLDGRAPRSAGIAAKSRP